MCNKCTFLYCDEPVTDCDCSPGENPNYTEGYAVFPSLPTLEDDAELQAETAALVDAVKRFLSAGPSPPVCYDFHHRRSERHEIGESCTPKDRYFTALTALQQALAKHGKGAES